MEERMEYEARRGGTMLSLHLRFDEEEAESEEDILLTYSSDNSLQEVTTASPKPLMQFSFEGDEPSMIDEHTDNDSGVVHQRPSSISVLTLPILSTSPFSQGSLHQRSFSDDGMQATLAVDYGVIEDPNVLTPSSTAISLDARQRPPFFDFRDAPSDAENLVRTTSVPMKSPIKREFNSPTDASSQQKPMSAFKKALGKPYSLDKQLSLPLTVRDRLPLLQTHLNHLPSGSSVEGVTKLSKDKSSPRNRGESPIFRQIRSRTPTTQNQTSSYLYGITRVDTDATDKSDEETGESQWTGTTRDIIAMRRHSACTPAENESSQGSDIALPESKPFLKQHVLQYVFHLSTYACFGTIIRVFLARLFGHDCEFGSINDWLYPLSRQICVTASGKTEQTGGALFTDLPANIIGSFIMGVLAVLKPDVWPPIPWLKMDHPLQKHDALHVAIRVGLCGSLTTFSSWNTQMIVMMDGSQTALGSQIVAAVCGYLLGTVAAIGSFCFGTHISAWLNNWRNPVVEGSLETEIEEMSRNTSQFDRSGVSRIQLCQFFKVLFAGRNIGFVILFILMTMFLVADIVFDVAFYRGLWMAVLLTPPGALLRWTLAEKWNDSVSFRGWCWLPMGTLAANSAGCLISIVVAAIESRCMIDADTSQTALILWAVGTGVAGSLSTVSTIVKELHELSIRYSNHAKPYYYWSITVVTAIFGSLIVYIPIVRSR